jgi:hypothetical protein
VQSGGRAVRTAVCDAVIHGGLVDPFAHAVGGRRSAGVGSAGYRYFGRAACEEEFARRRQALRAVYEIRMAAQKMCQFLRSRFGPLHRSSVRSLDESSVCSLDESSVCSLDESSVCSLDESSVCSTIERASRAGAVIQT